MSEWKQVRLGQLFSRVTRRNLENNTNILTASANYGLINQQEFFKKRVASKNISNYYLLYNGEFVYNKSYCDGYPLGAFKRLDMYDKGVVTTLYICFAVASDQVCSDFYLHLFESGLLNDELNNIAQEGARNHGLLNVGVKQFFENIHMPFPDINEQRCIATILTAADEAIAASRALVEKYVAIKQGLMQDLLTGQVRLPGYNDTWKLMNMSDMCHIPSTLVNPRLPQYCTLPHIGNENIEKGTGVLLPYRSAREDGLISGKYYFEKTDVLYGKIRPHLMKACYPRFAGLCSADMYPLRCTSKAIPEYLLYVLLSEHFTRYTVSVSMRSGMPKINRNELYGYERLMPSREEQIAIAEILTAADKRVSDERENLRKLENIKRGLMDDLLTHRVSTDILTGGL